MEVATHFAMTRPPKLRKLQDIMIFNVQVRENLAYIVDDGW